MATILAADGGPEEPAQYTGHTTQLRVSTLLRTGTGIHADGDEGPINKQL